jgi:alanyl-tRNA synthetase
MDNLSAAEIRSGFIDFFKGHGHKFIPSSPIVPSADQTLLFANAGMNQFKDIFLGLVPPEAGRAVNSQKCLRVSGKHNDLEEVGKDTYHHTFFEMLGNWSFDDYFKAEAIEWAWQLLTKVWHIEPGRLWATVFQGDALDDCPPDADAKVLWPKVSGIPQARVLFGGKEDNFWEMGETGPCGPCSEIHIDRGPDMCDKKNVPGHKCAVNGGCSRFIELWNLVFIQYNRTDDGKLLSLGAKYVDTGAGLERVAAVLQRKSSNYDTDLFMPIIESISQITGHRYASKLGSKTDNAFRVIADHIRAVVFAITDGAAPANDGRGYVIRRILRRASRFGRELGVHEPFIYKLVPVVVEVMGDAFSEIKERAEYVATVVESEEVSFGRTLDRGIEIFAAAAERAEKAAERTINGEDAFQLYDTYGFPLDLTQLMAEERGLTVDTTEFNELMEQQRERARADHLVGTAMKYFSGSGKTEDKYKYETDCLESNIVDIFHKVSSKKEKSIEAGMGGAITLDKTCFYANRGGQVGDHGVIESYKGKFVVDEAIYGLGDIIYHVGKMISGSFDEGDKVKAVVSKDRDATKKNHTATHLLQWALQQVLGRSATQQGSFVAPDYLRFDFTYPKAPTSEDLKKVESLVREKIAADLPVSWTVLPKDEAQQLGAMSLFGEKYGDEVRVVGIGAQSGEKIAEAFSREFCGGTHVDRLGSIGGFKIIKEESISAGVRRITAMTGQGLTDYLEQRSDIVEQLSQLLKVPAEAIAGRVEQLLAENKKLTKDLKSGRTTGAADTMAEAKKLLNESEKIGAAYVIVGRISTAPIERAREAIDMLKKKAKSAAIVLGFADGDKVTLLAGVTDDLVKKGLKADDIVRVIAPIVEGGGGGRPQMAQAGGKKPEKIEEALAKAKELINEKLAN